MKKRQGTGRGARLGLCAGRAVTVVGTAWLSIGCVTQAPQPQRARAVETSTVNDAWTATREGDWDVAAARWELVLEAGGGADPIACREAAKALLAAGDAERALEVVDMGLERSPADPALLACHGNVLDALGFTRAAERSFEDALVLAPDDVAVLRTLGRVRLDLDRANAALEPLERCLELGAGDTRTKLLYARALACSGQLERALTLFGEALAAEDVAAPDFVEAAGLMLAADGCRATSRAWLERAIELEPEHADAHFYLGVVLAAGGDDTAALQSWRRAAAFDAGHAAALECIADVHERRGNVEQAAKFRRRAEKASKRPRR